MEPLVIAGQGHFFTGLQTHAGPAGTSVYGTHVQWQAPPSVLNNLVLVHGGGGQALDMLTTPDGRPGGRRCSCGTGSRSTRLTGRGSGGRHTIRTSTGRTGRRRRTRDSWPRSRGRRRRGCPSTPSGRAAGTATTPALATFLAWQEPFPGSLVRANEDMRCRGDRAKPRRPGDSRQRARDDAGEEQRGDRRRNHRLDHQAHVTGETLE